MVAGVFEFVRATTVLTASPGDVLLILPNDPHTLRLAAGHRGGTISCIHGELLSNQSWAGGDYRFSLQPRTVTSVGDDTVMHQLFWRCSEAFGGYGRYHRELARTIAREIWLRLAEHWNQPGDFAVSHRVQAMVAYLRQHLVDGVGRQELAAAFHVTPEHVNYLFKRELGTSPTQFVLRERVLLAYRLMQEEHLSVKEAATRVGFSDPFYFSRVFTRIAGIRPSEV